MSDKCIWKPKEYEDFVPILWETDCGQRYEAREPEGETCSHCGKKIEVKE